MVLELLMVSCVLMEFGTLAKTEDRNWSFLLLLHDSCHCAPFSVLESDFRSPLHTAGLCQTVICSSMKDEYFWSYSAAAVVWSSQYYCILPLRLHEAGHTCSNPLMLVSAILRNNTIVSYQKTYSSPPLMALIRIRGLGQKPILLRI